MAISLPDLALFRAVVEAKGLGAAARRLESSPPAVSRGLTALEARLGVRLAERSSRRFRLTNEGMLLYDRACSILGQMQEAEAEVTSRGSIAKGALKIGAPSEFGRRYVAPLVAAFVQLHPGLRASLILSDAGLDVGEDAFDVVLQVGLPSDETLIARKIATTPCVTCAAPSYLANRPPPAAPEHLAAHECLLLVRRNRVQDEWTFIRDGTARTVKVQGSLSSPSGDVLHGWVLDGYGISIEAAWDVADDLASGALVALLPDDRPPSINVYATFVSNRLVPPRIRLFVSFLTEQLAQLHPD